MKRLLVLLVIAALLTGCAGPAVPTDPGQTTEEPTTSGDSGTGLGQKVPDFAVTTVEGEELLLSEILKEKKLVVLNFWFADWIWCIREFPVLELAYGRYKADVEVLALTPYDDMATAEAFADDHSLSFPVSTCHESFAQAFGVNGYPTSVFIDREGRISLIHPGAITDSNVFYSVFDAYTAEDYTHGTYYRLDELLR